MCEGVGIGSAINGCLWAVTTGIMAEETVRGQLLVRVEEAGGKTQSDGKDVFVWDASATAHLQVTGAFVKGAPGGKL